MKMIDLDEFMANNIETYREPPPVDRSNETQHIAMLEILLEHTTKPFLLDDFPASSMIYPANNVMIMSFIEQFVKFAREEVDFRLGLHLHDSLVFRYFVVDGEFHQHPVLLYLS